MVKQRSARSILTLQRHHTEPVDTDLDPVPVNMRTWGGLEYWAYWTSDMLAPPLASTVSSVMSLGFTARETIPIVFFGFAICSCVITLTAKMGAQYSISFPILVRSIFGMYGSYFAISVRAFVAAMWTGMWYLILSSRDWSHFLLYETYPWFFCLFHFIDDWIPDSVSYPKLFVC